MIVDTNFIRTRKTDEGCEISLWNRKYMPDSQHRLQRPECEDFRLGDCGQDPARLCHGIRCLRGKSGVPVRVSEAY